MMSLKNALVNVGICELRDWGNLTFRVQISDGIRNVYASSRRYFVYLKGRIICSVKRLPGNGIFNIEDVIKTQKLFSEFSTSGAPAIYGVYYSNDGYVYIIEEPVPSSITLQDAVAKGEVSPKSAALIMEEIFQNVAMQPALDFDPDLLDKEASEFLTVAEVLNIPADLIEWLKIYLEENLKQLVGSVKYTSRDLIPRNILISNEKTVVVDFDLSRKTHFFWLDVLRSKYYSKDVAWDEYPQYMPEGIDPRLLELLFFLTEVRMAQLVLTDMQFLQTIDYFRNKTLSYFKKLSILNEKCINDGDLRNILFPKVDGQNVTEFKGNILQVFWDNKEIFKEEASVKVSLLADNSFHQYEIPLPNGAEGSLRIDPGERPIYLQIRSIGLYADNTDESEELIPLVVWDDENSFDGLVPGSGGLFLPGQESKRLLFLNNDPQFFLMNIPKRHDKYSWILRLVMNASEEIPPSIASEINQIQEELISRKEQLNRQANELLQAKEKLSVNEEQLSRLKESLINIQTEVTQKEEQLRQVFNSRSWRITASLRWLGMQVRRLKQGIKGIYYIIIGRKFRLELSPLHHLEKTGEIGYWKSVGNDPQFLLNGIWPVGWIEVSWRSAANMPLPLQLYWDQGVGINEGQSMVFGSILPGGEMVQKAVIYLSPLATTLRLDPGEAPGEFLLTDLTIVKISRLHLVTRAIATFFKLHGISFSTLFFLGQKAWRIYKNEGIRGLWKKAKGSSDSNVARDCFVDYQLWLKRTELTQEKKKTILAHIPKLTYQPLISVIVPVYNVEECWLRKCIESVQNQLYPNWELCIADDASSKEHVRKVLQEYAAKDSRIKIVFRETNGHISEASNSALELATGEFIALLDHDDELTPDALYENVVLLNQHPEADMIYSDEDKISEDGKRHSPFFKPDWSPDTILSQMYTCHLGVYRTSLVREIGGFRKGFEGSQDYDLVLRLTEQTDRIYHIPKVLYHWRTIPQSTALSDSSKGYTQDAGYRAVKEAVARRKINGWVETVADTPHVYRVHHRPSGQPLISILIPTRDMADTLDVCLSSIFEKTSYQNFEVIIIDNGSLEEHTFEIFDKWLKKEPQRIRIERIDIPFNYSRLNNLGAKLAKGELLLLLNNDVEVLSPHWLEEMAGQAVRLNIGAVGAMLLYPDNTIQHAGVILVGGVAGHSHKYFEVNSLGYYCRLRMVSNYSAVTAACLMVRKDVFERVGGLDETLAVAFNDVDFCLKLTQQGFYNVWLPHVRLYHYESKSRGHEDTPEKQERFLKEINIMKERWGNLLANDPFYNRNLSNDREDFSIGIPR